MTVPPAHRLVMDLGGVTCRWLPDRRLAALADLSGLPAATIDAQVFESGWDDACERGRFVLDELLDQLTALLALTRSPATDELLRSAWAQAFEPDPRVLALIGRATCPTALFTNNGPLLEAALPADLPAVADAFDELVFSWHLGTTKPDPDAFAGAVERLGVDPATILFVDDSEANVEAARAAGWQAHQYTDPMNLQLALHAAELLGPSRPS